MKFENLDKLFELYVQEAVRKNKEKYSSHEALEDDLGMLFNRFENVRIKTLDGKTVGTHSGVFYYTVGQRKGFGLGGAGNGEPWYVVKKDVENNILYVNQGECDLLFTKELTTRGFNFITKKPDEKEFRVLARIRHRQPLENATAVIDGDDVHLYFDRPQRAVAAGQYAVMYEVGSPICLGGGEIR